MATSASGQNVQSIEMMDMTGFKFVIINILGHDYMISYLVQTEQRRKCCRWK